MTDSAPRAESTNFSDQAYAPPARPTLVYLPRRHAPWRAPAMIVALGICVATVFWWFTDEQQPDTLAAAVQSAPPTADPVEALTRDADEAWAGFARQLPPPPEAPPFALTPPDVAALGGAAPDGNANKVTLHLGKGGTLAGLLATLDLERSEIARALAALRPHLDIRRLQVGQSVHVTLEESGDDDQRILRGLTVRPEARREIKVERQEDGTYRAEEKIFEVLKKFHRVAGLITDSLILSTQRAGLPHGALADMLRAFAFDVSFQHDLKAGDRFSALVEEVRTVDGRLVGAGKLLWAKLTSGGGTNSFTVYRFQPTGGRDFFYTSTGESVVRALLRTPLDLARLTVSSAFGMRHHPLLGFNRMHSGVDFPAPPGTPVLAAGDGRVAQAGPNGGYGNWVKIVHSGTLATGYAHMMRIANGIRPGAAVHQSQVIGFVGSTGLSTGPHLHFELQRNGAPVDPLGVAQEPLRTKLAGPELARFLKVVDEVDRLRSSL